MKDFIRNWLGINADLQAVAADVNTLLERSDTQARQSYEIFHALPFVAGALMLTAKDAAAITQPHGIQANSLPALLMGIEDPQSNAHAPNESLHEGDWQNLMRSLALLFDKLGALPGGKVK